MKYSRFGEDTQYSWSKLTFHNCSHMTQQAIASASGGTSALCSHRKLYTLTRSKCSDHRRSDANQRWKVLSAGLEPISIIYITRHTRFRHSLSRSIRIYPKCTDVQIEALFTDQNSSSHSACTAFEEGSASLSFSRVLEDAQSMCICASISKYRQLVSFMQPKKSLQRSIQSEPR